MTITMNDLEGFTTSLRLDEKSKATMEKYRADAGEFIAWLDGRELTKDETIRWKEHLCGKDIVPGTVNSKLNALNSLLGYMGREDCKVKFLKIQHQPFREPKKEMTWEEYQRLQDAAKKKGDTRMSMVMETIVATGIRVSELKFITVEAAQTGRAIVNMKGKIRTVLITDSLAKKLLNYAKGRKIASGPIFITRNGNPMGRKQIWSKMKAFCAEAGVDSSKVFPHNLRHLFARLHYKRYHNIVSLADILGHSSIETTRIYLVTTGKEYAKQLEALRLVS